MKRALSIIATCLPSLAQANFVSDNLLAIFYHELGHAITYQMNIPIFGQEEDAADTLSTLMIDAHFEPDLAEEIIVNVAARYQIELAEEGEIALWAMHGASEQRYYNMICLFYGADPDERSDFANKLKLPLERQETCPDEYELAADSWFGVLDEMVDDRSLTGKLVYEGTDTDSILATEISALNEDLSWPTDVPVYVESCGEENAFYDIDEGSIIMCIELETWLQEAAKDNNL